MGEMEKEIDSFIAHLSERQIVELMNTNRRTSNWRKKKQRIKAEPEKQVENLSENPLVLNFVELCFVEMFVFIMSRT